MRGLPLFLHFMLNYYKKSGGYLFLVTLLLKSNLIKIMKKNLLLGLVGCLFLAGPVKAQLGKGTKYWGGTLSFSGVNNKSKNDFSSSVNQLSLSPSIQAGKFIKDNRMIGLGLGATIYYLESKDSNNRPDSKYSTTENSYSLSPFIRHYKSLSPKWAIFLNSSAQLSYMTMKLKIYGDKRREDGYGAGLQILPGVAYWVSPRFALESDINFLSLGAGYKDFLGAKSVYFNSALTSSLTSYFSIRASWYLQKP